MEQKNPSSVSELAENICISILLITLYQIMKHYNCVITLDRLRWNDLYLSPTNNNDFVFIAQLICFIAFIQDRWAELIDSSTKK